MGKQLSDGLKRLSFMNRTAAPSSGGKEPLKATNAASASQEPGQSQAAAAPKVSSKLLQLKFMQRAQMKEDLQHQQEEAVKRKAEECFVFQHRQVGGCRVQFEDAPAVAVAAGRISFQNFNPAVDQAAEELRRRTQLAEAAAAERDASVSDAAMAGALAKRKRGQSDAAEGGDTRAPPTAAVDAAARVKVEGAGLKRVKLEGGDADETDISGAPGGSGSRRKETAEGARGARSEKQRAGAPQDGAGGKKKKLKTKAKGQADGRVQKAGAGLGGVPRDKLLERLKSLKSAAC